MSWNKGIRTTHRWLSIILTVAIIINIVALVMGSQAGWIGALAFVPLMFMMMTGLYLFVLPYAKNSTRDKAFRSEQSERSEE